MALLRIKSSAAHVAEVIDSWYESGNHHGLRFSKTQPIRQSEQPDCSSSQMSLHGVRRLCDIDLHLRIVSENRDSSLLDMTPSAGRRYRTTTMSLDLILVLLMAMVVVYLSRSWVMLINLNVASRSFVDVHAFALDIIRAIGAFLMYFIISIGLFAFASTSSRRLLTALNSLCSYINARVDSSMVLPFYESLVPKLSAFISGSLLAAGILWLFFAARLGFLAFIFLLLFLITLIPFGLRLSIAHTQSSEWKRLYMTTAYRWSFVCAAFLIGVSLSGLPLVVQNLASPDLPFPGLSIGYVLTHFVRPENLHFRPDFAFVKWKFLIAVFTALPLVCFYLSLWYCSSAISDWRLLSATTDGHPRPPLPELAEHSTKHAFEVAFFLCHYVVCSSITLAASLLSIDGFAFLIAGRPLVFHGLWISTAELFRAAFAPSAALILDKGYVALMCVPLLTGVILNIRRLGLLLFRPVLFRVKNRHIASAQGDSKVASVLDHLASSASFDRPDVTILNTHSIKAFTRARFFGGRSILFLSQGALQLYDGRELAAVIAHEIGHSTSVLRTIEWIRLISVASFFSNYYLMLCLDFTSQEYEADSFAMKTTKDADALVSAIVKSATSGLLRSAGRKPWRSNGRRQALGKLFVMAEFLFGEGLLGYGHPPALQRLANIDRLVSKNE